MIINPKSFHEQIFCKAFEKGDKMKIHERVHTGGSHLPVPNVTSPLQTIVIWWNISWLIDIFLNYLSNLKQANSFSPLWILLCIFKTSQCANYATFGSGKWLLCSKDPLIGSQTTTLYKSLITLWTDKWLFSCEGHFMSYQINTSQKCLVTLAIRKGFSPPWILACLFNSLHNFSYILYINGAGKWFLSWVDIFMFL